MIFGAASESQGGSGASLILGYQMIPKIKNTWDQTYLTNQNKTVHGNNNHDGSGVCIYYSSSNLLWLAKNNFSSIETRSGSYDLIRFIRSADSVIENFFREYLLTSVVNGLGQRISA